MPEQNQKLYSHELVLTTDPPMIEINSNQAPGLFKRFFVRDSMIEYFPYMEFVINDDAGLFIEDNYFTEGLKWSMEWRIVDDEDSDAVLEHDFYWSETQIPQTFSPDVAQGDVIFAFLSDFEKQDERKSKSWNKNISAIVREIMNEYQYPGDKPKSQKIKVAETVNPDFWYQSEQTDAYLIDSIFSTYAYNPAWSKSPWFSWINLRGEFHFEPLAKILQQASKGTFVFGYEEKDFDKIFLKSQNADIIHNFSILPSGAPTNKQNWNRKFQSIKSDGTIDEKEVSLKDKFDPQGQNKFNIRRDDLDNIRTVSRFGVIDNRKQENMYKGWVNSEFINSTSFPFRLKIMTNFRPDICAGDVIETEILSTIEDKDFLAQEFSGKWVVIDSVHGINEKGLAGSAFVIGKSSVNIFRDHRFYKDFF